MFALHSRRIKKGRQTFHEARLCPSFGQNLASLCVASHHGRDPRSHMPSCRSACLARALQSDMRSRHSAAWLILVAHNCCIENRIIAIGGRDLRPRTPSSHATCFARAPQSDMRPRHSTAWVIFDHSPLLHRQPPPCHPKPGPPHAVLSRHVSRPGAAVSHVVPTLNSLGYISDRTQSQHREPHHHSWFWYCLHTQALLACHAPYTPDESLPRAPRVEREHLFSPTALSCPLHVCCCSRIFFVESVFAP